MNLLKETLDAITMAGKTPEYITEVQWTAVTGMNRSDRGYVANAEVFGTTWDRFAETITNVEYDEGFGAQKINSSLKIVFGDMSWLEREEYDGAERWIYKCSPKPAKTAVLDDKSILRNVWEIPCSCCMYDEHGFDSDRCNSCRSFSKWEEKK